MYKLSVYKNNIMRKCYKQKIILFIYAQINNSLKIYLNSKSLENTRRIY